MPARTTVDGNYQKYKIVATFIGIYKEGTNYADEKYCKA